MTRFTGDSLTCVRGERVVFAGVGFAVTAGGALVLRGANGAGKSSLLRVMAGLIRPREGALAWAGAPVAADPAAHRARLLYIGHADAVKPALTAAENLRFWASQREAAPHRLGEGVRRALDAFGIARLADLPARCLSQGQRRRLALARLALEPATLWLLDEPKTALDAASAGLLDAAARRHRDEGGMIVLAQHGGEAPAGADVLDLGAG